MTDRTRLLLLTTGMAAFILLGLAQAIFGPVLPVYAKAFDLQIASVSWVLSLFWLGCLGAVIAVYLLPAALGPKSGLALAALGTGLMALMLNWPLVLLGAVLFGAGYGVIAAVYNPRVLAAFGPRGPAMMSLLNAIFTIGAIAAPQIFLAFDRNPGLTFFSFAAFTTAILAATLLMGDTRVTATAQTTDMPIDPLTLGFAAFGIGLESSLVGLGPTALVLAGKTEVEATQLLSLFFLTYLAARLSLVFIAHLIPAFVLYSMSVSLLGVLTAAILLGADIGVVFPMMGFACGPLFHGAYLTGLKRMEASTRVSALLLGAGLVGAILLPMGISQLLAGLGPMGFFQIAMALTAAMALAAWASARRMLRAA